MRAKGTDASGTAALGNSGRGVFVALPGERRTLIGTNGDGMADDAERNVISGNATGIFSQGGQNQVTGNFIGLGANGNPLGNTDYGLFISAGHFNRIGGEGPLANTIAFNGADGIRLDRSFAMNNSLRGNSIYSNGRLGIDLGADVTGVTPNDVGDGDGGSNNSQNYPVLTEVSGGNATRVEGSLNSLAGTSFIIDAARLGT